MTTIAEPPAAAVTGLRRPLPLAYHPLYRFYEGGSLTRQFRGLPDRPDDWWSEDWVGSCTAANNSDPNGGPQGMSSVDLPGVGTTAGALRCFDKISPLRKSFQTTPTVSTVDRNTALTAV